MKKSVSYLKEIHKFFKENTWDLKDYNVPNLWIYDKPTSGSSSLSFNEFYLHKLEEILSYDRNEDYNQSLSKINNEHHGIGGDWSYYSVVYNAFPRFTAAFDHNLTGDLKDFSHEGKFIKKTGTFLKMISMLSYIKGFGCNVLHLMPITKIGIDGNRGDLGSPYAIKNPYHLDENLAETAIPFSVEEQFKALVEACHLLGIRVVLEFVLRTASLDSDWVKSHPDWFYWIKKDQEKNYTKPIFSAEEISYIKNVPYNRNYCIPPSKEYQNIFAKPPPKEQISFKNNKFIAKTEEGELIIPGAFADWPPDDQQPPWDDVTYLKLYNDNFSDHNFNYIAYNTIRYYDKDLEKEENRNLALWDALVGIIPHYQKSYGIDGVMLDMGHALPEALMKRVIEESRKVDSDFCFWEENFEINKTSRITGFNATLGFEWEFKEHEIGIRNMLITANRALPLPFFGTPETHNTPRLKNLLIKKQYWLLNSLLPSCLPFIHTGYELNEAHPVNTGLNFTHKELERYNGFPLALFNRQSLDWDASVELVEFMQKIALLRLKNQEWIATGDERTLTILYPENRFGKIIAFQRHDAFQPWKTILVLMNVNMEGHEKFFLNLFGTYNNQYVEYLSGDIYSFEDHWMSGELKPGECLLFEIHKLL